MWNEKASLQIVEWVVPTFLKKFNQPVRILRETEFAGLVTLHTPANVTHFLKYIYPSVAEIHAGSVTKKRISFPPLWGDALNIQNSPVDVMASFRVAPRLPCVPYEH